MTPAQKAKLVAHALSGEHLSGWLPGGDNKAAISHAVSCGHGWTGDECGKVTKAGIETYASLDDMFADRPKNRVTWREVLDIVARGATGERLEAYEAAFSRWGAWAAAGGYSPGKQTPEQREAHHVAYVEAANGIRDTSRAIIEAGCEVSCEQGLLW